MRNADILERYYKDVWEEGQLDRITTYFNCVHDPDRIVPRRGIEPCEIREWVSIVRSFITDIKIRLVHTIEQDDWLSAMIEISAKDMRTQAPVLVHQQIMLRFVDGQTIESYPFFDFLSFFEQLGHLPQDVHALLLGGNVLSTAGLDEWPEHHTG